MDGRLYVRLFVRRRYGGETSPQGISSRTSELLLAT